MAVGFAPAEAINVLNAYYKGTALTAPSAVWAQVHTAAPGAAGTTAAVVSGVRQQINAKFGTASTSGAATTLTSNSAITWTSVPNTEVYSFITTWDASTGTTRFLTSGTVSSTGVNATDDFSFVSGNLQAVLANAS